MPIDSLIPAAIIAALIALNGLFVAAEFAIVGAPRLAIERRARDGQRLARVVQRILERPREQDRFIATAQLGITFASLGLGMYGEHVLAEGIGYLFDAWGVAGWGAAHALAIAASIGVLTYLHTVVGEIVPKSLALQRAEHTVLWITPVMMATRTLLYPLVVTLNGMGYAILNVFGVDRQASTHEEYYTAKELELIVAESQSAGALPAEAGRLIHEIFEFGDLNAAQVMTPRVGVTGLPVGSDAGTIEATLQTSPHTRYPVYREHLDQVIGVVHVKDLVRIMLAGGSLEPTFARPIPIVPETAMLDSVLTAMRKGRTQMALVVDEHGGTGGVITLQDLFEEVVGPFDESGSSLAEIYVDTAGRLRVPGTVRLDEVGDRMTVSLEHEDVDSVSGLVLTLLGRPPMVGDRVTYANLELEVTAVRGYGVAEAAICRTRPR